MYQFTPIACACSCALDLFSPTGHTVSDGIDTEVCSLYHSSVDAKSGRDPTCQGRHLTSLLQCTCASRQSISMTRRQEVFRILQFGQPYSLSPQWQIHYCESSKKNVQQLHHYLDNLITLGVTKLGGKYGSTI